MLCKMYKSCGSKDVNYIWSGQLPHWLQRERTYLMVSPCFMSTYGNWYIIGKHLCSTYRICKKDLQVCRNWNFFLAKSSYEVKMFAKKKFPKMIKYTFLKRKTKNLQISTYGLYANNLQKFLYKTWAIRFLMSYAFQKAKNFLTT